MHDQAVQANKLCLIFFIDKYFTTSRQKREYAQNEDTHALKQHRLSQNGSPVYSSFALVIASDMHLEPESKKREKNVYFHTDKNIQIQSTVFRYF